MRCPVVSQAVGARDEEAIARAVWRGLILALVVSIPSSILLLFTGPVLEALNQPAEIVPISHEYTLRIIPSVIAFFAFGVFRQVLQAMGRLAPIVWATLIANVFNVFGNWVLIFGKLGIEPMGVAEVGQPAFDSPGLAISDGLMQESHQTGPIRREAVGRGEQARRLVERQQLRIFKQHGDFPKLPRVGPGKFERRIHGRERHPISSGLAG